MTPEDEQDCQAVMDALAPRPSHFLQGRFNSGVLTEMHLDGGVCYDDRVRRIIEGALRRSATVNIMRLSTDEYVVTAWADSDLTRELWYDA